MTRFGPYILLFLLVIGLAGCNSGERSKQAVDADPKKRTDSAPGDKEEEDTPDRKEPRLVLDTPTDKGTARPRLIEFTTDQGATVRVTADHDPWADRVVSFRPGKPAAKLCTTPETTLGKPDYKLSIQGKTCLSLGHRGELVLEFVDNRLIDGPGDDLVVFEVGPVVEPMDLAISITGAEWITLGQLKGARCSVDIGPFVRSAQESGTLPALPRPEFRFVRITDAGAGLSNNSQKAGADVDAVGALNSIPAVP